MNVLVTGGMGYVGSTVVPLLLNQGKSVRVIDNLLFETESLLSVWSHPDFEFVLGDIRNSSDIDAALEGMDSVVHLAAIVGDPACAKDPELAQAVNYDATMALIESSRSKGIERFVFASTCSNYGKMPDPTQAVTEETILTPLSLYAETKVAVEKILLGLEVGNGMCATPLRISTLYGAGPRMRFDLTVNEFVMEMAVNGKLLVFGEQFWRPYIHVRDIARAIVLVLDSPRELVDGEVFNVGSSDQNFRKKEIVEMILAHVPEATIEYVHKDEDPRDYRVSFEKIARQLDFQLTRNVDDGIKEILEIIRNGIITDFKQPRYRNS